VICFTKSLARQAAPYKIKGNAVCPCPARTAMTDAWGDSVNRSFAGKISWKEYGEPEDVAAEVAFPAVDSAGYITGETPDANDGFIIDGLPRRRPRNGKGDLS
jgi:3-oxoacyl-[acyl-carrier protein] reductase